MGYVHIKEKEKLGKWYCLNCKRWLDDVIWEEVDEDRGEFWGVPCTEHCIYVYCPYCKDESVIEADEIILDDEEDEDE